ncbi:restriction endonuclease subunit S [Bacillus pumilus]|uniref:restriction endonuclease subunit S n=2 Tax=Bacillus altitudinis TaxID=293387 RepID=UPI00080A9822|nr:hypothetical protein VP59_12580 [Bacillus pumilus]
MIKNNLPEIRFDGYTGEWKQSKIGDYYFFKNGLNKGKEFFGSGTPIVNFTDVFHNRDISFSNLKGRVQLNEFEIKNYEVKKGDIFFTRTSETIEEIGYSSVMIDHPCDTVFSGFVLRARAINEDPLEINFKRYVFFTENFREEMKKKSSMTTRALTTGTAIKDMEFFFPNSKEEQTQIGNLFKQIDETIAIHQQELDTLKQTKQGFLQKMFPKEGESVPEIRFPGFSGEWGKKRLKDLATFAKGIGYSKSDLVEEGEPIILYGRLYTKYQTVIEEVDTFTKIKEKSLISKGYEVIVPSSGETSEDIARASVVKRPDIILGGDLNVIYPCDEINSIFLALAISNGKQQKELSKKAQGKSVVHLHNSDLKEVNLYYPKREEQTQIASFFKQLDKTIALHEQELDILKQTKKAFLQKMFV